MARNADLASGLMAGLLALIWASSSAAEPKPVPLVDFRVEKARMLWNEEQMQSTLEWDGRRAVIPGKRLITDMVSAGEGKLMIVTRDLFTDTFGLWLAQDQKGRIQLERTPSPLGHQEILTQLLFSSGDWIYLVAYDVHRQTNQVFRRRQNASAKEGWDKTYRFDMKFGALYELNVPLFHMRTNGKEHVCGGETCFTLHEDRISDSRTPPGYALIDVASGQAAAYGLYVAVIDDRTQPLPAQGVPVYFLRRLPDGELKPLPVDRVPGRIALKGGQADIHYLKTPGDAAASFFADLAHAPNGGTLLMGTSNRDGRLAWGQVYYLNGLIDLISTQYRTPLLPLSEQQKQAVAERVSLEIALLDRLIAEDFMVTLAARRYSLKREPLIASMHLSRILRLLTRYQEEHPKPRPLASLKKLKQETLSLKNTFMEQARRPDGSRYLKFRRGVPFWCDGVNVPHNMQTGWVEGLVMAYKTNELPKAAEAVSRDIMRIWFESEIASTDYPKDMKWHYWWGEGYNGYDAASKISVNTPAYAGDKAIAHISYRTMDAMGALELMRRYPDALPEDLVPYFKRGVEQGGLWPFVAEALAPFGKRPCIPPSVGRLYARYSSSYELQNSVWALSDLTRCR